MASPSSARHSAAGFQLAPAFAAASAATTAGAPREAAAVTTTHFPATASNAREALDAVIKIADAQATRTEAGASTVSVGLKFGEEHLDIRVEMRDGEVHTRFSTDSTDLRTALSSGEWQTLTFVGRFRAAIILPIRCSPRPVARPPTRAAAPPGASPRRKRRRPRMDFWPRPKSRPSHPPSERPSRRAGTVRPSATSTPSPDLMQITSAIAAASAGLSAASAATGSGTATPPPPAATVTSGANQTVSTSQFMQLLSTEMANQDPMQPMDPTATMTQLAQFSSLQQTSQLSQYQSLAAANSFLGTQVTIPGTNGAPAVTGVVTAIDSSQVGAGRRPN